jgi:hypothetical protein
MSLPYQYINHVQDTLKIIWKDSKKKQFQNATNDGRFPEQFRGYVYDFIKGAGWSEQTLRVPCPDSLDLVLSKRPYGNQAETELWKEMSQVFPHSEWCRRRSQLHQINVAPAANHVSRVTLHRTQSASKLR